MKPVKSMKRKPEEKPEMQNIQRNENDILVFILISIRKCDRRNAKLSNTKSRRKRNGVSKMREAEENDCVKRSLEEEEEEDNENKARERKKNDEKISKMKRNVNEILRREAWKLRK